MPPWAPYVVPISVVGDVEVVLGPVALSRCEVGAEAVVGDAFRRSLQKARQLLSDEAVFASWSAHLLRHHYYHHCPGHLHPLKQSAVLHASNL